MIKFSEKRLLEIAEKAHQNRIIVFGDLMVDQYLWGNVSRISPEAPVPIINISSEQVRFGGAANVAFNIIGLKANPLLIGVLGDDRMGHIFQDMLKQSNLSNEGIVMVPGRPTTVKTRIIGNNQHVARVDQESVEQISSEIQEQLYKIFVSQIENVAAIVIEDYNKGVVAPQLVKHVSELAERNDKIITVDPKFENFFAFKNVTVFKPNVKETEEALAMRIRDDETLTSAGKKLLSMLNAKAVLVTRGSRGMALFEKSGDHDFIETQARKVADVSGAGDTVIATLTFALSGGSSIKEAVTLSNYAAGIVCEEVGVVPVNLENLIEVVLRKQNSGTA
ncbi:MAG: D-glycero-beta-D-manno-heptose-7-phosphate kinase [Calditrichota bacterium]